MGQQYFGEPWPSGVCEEGTQVPTPVEKTCLYCDEQIVEGDQGTFMTTGQLGEDKKSMDWIEKPVHKECSMRQVLGSVGHLEQKCSCFGGSGTGDKPGVTLRQSALATWAWVMRQKK